ncbi:hypothetical protein GUITHDRAFT_147571 [Guillardia theta CCMP2712]|uniref:FAD dependent oxidoreductase domain-containing protein n=1 Tax=Guillardia theta (strain CCMP2712) TaxID=905079 RepID=L1ICJ0_GUITC|nr:hypothetical protein GUITHDRAFT_147571 [Guillardia theta CCMP2712]EKX33948.1 hypothetical protein GUITHDRAFT_147571 [Guillardia theta CCMP2712]|eukprot:XP_005820928.1 hypothetical protein GUITHDRAFT_147571 [Guillardia theta CCMP2712]
MATQALLLLLLLLPPSSSSSSSSRMSSGKVDCVIVDEQDVGQGGATGAMAGLLHPLTPRGKKLWKGDEGMEATRRLLRVAQQFSEEEVFFNGEGRGILRVVTKGKKQLEDYKKSAAMFPAEVELKEVDQSEYRGPSENVSHALLVKSGMAVRGPVYARALLRACQSLGNVTWRRERVESLAQLDLQQADELVRETEGL